MDRRTTRGLIDTVFGLAVVACLIAWSRPPRVPETVCHATTVRPHYDALYAGGLTIVAVLAELDGQLPGLREQSRELLVRSLRARGFHEVAGDRFVRGEIRVDIVLVEDVRDELTAALAQYDIVYYNGHSERGEIAIEPPGGYRIVMLDSCWTTQLYSPRLVGRGLDVVSNTAQSITGSIESLAIVIDGLHARADWNAMLENMNGRASQRAAVRPVYRASEAYRLDAACDGL